MRSISLVILLLCITYLLPGINVGGHITSDTTWSPGNNPYVVTTFLYVDAGVTLTIEPGTEVRVYDADGSNYGANFDWNGGQQPVAKAIVVNGKIIAIGTADQPIVFDNYSGDPYRRWGGIIVMHDAPRSTFRYCNISHQYQIQVGSFYSNGALHFMNGFVDVRNCRFYDVSIGIQTYYLAEPALIYGCDFKSEHMMPYYYDPWCYSIDAVSTFPNGFVDVFFVNCSVSGDITLGGGCNITQYFIRNKIRNIERTMAETRPIIYGGYSFYGSYFENSGAGVSCYAHAESDTAYCRRNTLIQTQPPFNNTPARLAGLGNGTIFIADNYAYGNVQIFVDMPDSLETGYIYNNRMVTNAPFAIDMDLQGTLEEPYDIYVFNNVIVGLPENTFIIDCNTSGHVRFNTMYGSDYILANLWNTPYRFRNNVFSNIASMAMEDLPPYWDFPVFSYNALSCPISFPHFDEGGNIYTDPMLVDTLNYDFRLQAGSPCIDAGVVVENMPAFDADYNLRVAGSAPDMGAYEYGSVYMGGIQGYVYDAQTLQPLDCAQIKIAGKLPEFSDSLGCFPYPTGAGTYTVTVKRFDYADLVIPNVEVSVGDTTWLNLPLQLSTEATDENILPLTAHTVSLYNYPNPFHSSTGINFILPEKSVARLAVYNLKGQKVQTITDKPLAKGHHSYTWDGRDEAGKACSTGIYLVKLSLDGKAVSSRKVTLVK